MITYDSNYETQWLRSVLIMVHGDYGLRPVIQVQTDYSSWWSGYDMITEDVLDKTLNKKLSGS